MNTNTTTTTSTKTNVLANELSKNNINNTSNNNKPKKVNNTLNSINIKHNLKKIINDYKDTRIIKIKDFNENGSNELLIDIEADFNKYKDLFIGVMSIIDLKNNALNIKMNEVFVDGSIIRNILFSDKIKEETTILKEENVKLKLDLEKVLKDIEINQANKISDENKEYIEFFNNEPLQVKTIKEQKETIDKLNKELSIIIESESKLKGSNESLIEENQRLKQQVIKVDNLRNELEILTKSEAKIKGFYNSLKEENVKLKEQRNKNDNILIEEIKSNYKKIYSDKIKSYEQLLLKKEEEFKKVKEDKRKIQNILMVVSIVSIGYIVLTSSFLTKLF